MTISKKLSIAAVLAIGIQLSAGAYFNAQDKRNAETALVVNFTQDLYNQNSTQTQEIAQWLDRQAIRQTEWVNGYIIDETWYPNSIVNVITNNNLTEKTKISLLSKMIAQEKRDNRKSAIRQCVSDICAGAVCLGVAALMTWAIIEDIKNPKPRPRNSVTITYKTSPWYTRQYYEYPNWYGHPWWY